jgi:hypothetical protein
MIMMMGLQEDGDVDDEAALFIVTKTVLVMMSTDGQIQLSSILKVDVMRRPLILQERRSHRFMMRFVLEQFSRTSDLRMMELLLIMLIRQEQKIHV